MGAASTVRMDASVTEQLLCIANAVDEADNALLPGLFRVFEEDFMVRGWHPPADEGLAATHTSCSFRRSGRSSWRRRCSALRSSRVSRTRCAPACCLHVARLHARAAAATDTQPAAPEQVWGYVADRRPRRPLLTGACFTWGVLTLLVAMAQSFGAVIALRRRATPSPQCCLCGLAKGAPAPAVEADTVGLAQLERAGPRGADAAVAVDDL